jgi:hypothetical protein
MGNGARRFRQAMSCGEFRTGKLIKTPTEPDKMSFFNQPPEIYGRYSRRSEITGTSDPPIARDSKSTALRRGFDDHERMLSFLCAI